MSDGRSRVTFFTTHSDLVAYTNICRGMRHAVIMLSGDGNESGIDSEFSSFARELADRGIGSAQVEYRFPDDCAQCAIDALLVCQYLDDEGITDVALVGWSFGADVALAAGSVARIVHGVAAISPSSVSEVFSRRMGAKQLLVMRDDDESGDLLETRHRAHARLVEWLLRLFDPARASSQTAPAGASLAR